VTLWTLEDHFLAQQRRAARGAHFKDSKVTDYYNSLRGINENEYWARFHSVCLLSCLHAAFFVIAELAADMYAAPLCMGQVKRQGEKRGEKKRIASSRSCVSGRPQRILLIYEERVCRAALPLSNLMGGMVTYSILVDGGYCCLSCVLVGPFR
jgi:hypothetical protein